MINLNAYINKTVEMQLGEDVVHVRVPSTNQMAQIAGVESTIGANEKKTIESKPKIAQILINNNLEGKKFELDLINQIPLRGLVEIITAVITAKIEVEQDPNSDSQSPKAK